MKRASQTKSGGGGSPTDRLSVRSDDAAEKRHRRLSPRALRSGLVLPLVRSLRASLRFSRVRTLSRKQYFLFLVCFLAAAHIIIIRPLLIILFGPKGSPIGGMLGIFVDANLRWYLFRRAARSWEQRLKEKGIALPDPTIVPSTAKLKTLPNVALGETLLLLIKRRNILAELAKAASDYEKECLSSSKADGAIPAIIPNVILRPLNRPGVYASPLFETLTFTQSEMDRLVEEYFRPLYDKFQSLPTQKRTMVWTMCALHIYGGVHVSEDGVNYLSELESVIATNQNGQGSCASPLGYAVVPLEGMSDASHMLDIPLMAVSPRHPLLRCIISQIIDSGSPLSYFRQAINLLTKEDDGRAGWVLASHECGAGRDDTSGNSECCREVSSVQVADPAKSSHEMQKTVGDASHMFVSVQDRYSSVMLQRVPSPHVDVSIYQSKDTPISAMVPKLSLQELLRRRTWCEPSWLCNRCLKAPIYGSYSRCSFVCGKCAKRTICDSPDAQIKKDIRMEVRISRGKVSSGPTARLIPRIVHQTWFEELTPERYPQLVRLQNSWRNTAGWDYRFYDDKSAETYIEEHFPSRFLSAFKALQPGAYKADFFRYLVLLKDGGVYADVDVMLDTNLDALISPKMSFFAPRDAVGEHVGENFCLWNGLIGSAPGHPFVVRAVERMLNLILNRADFYDMERDICNRNSRKEVETWKSRIEPNLLLSGPCALGVSVNEAIGNDSHAKFDVGWLKPRTTLDTSAANSHFPGDALILMLDKTDLGAMRLSDPERNMMVASTDMPGLSKVPLTADTSLRGGGGHNERSHEKDRPPHYSLAGKGDWIWGTKYVYTDKLVANEKVTLAVNDVDAPS